MGPLEMSLDVSLFILPGRITYKHKHTIKDLSISHILREDHSSYQVSFGSRERGGEKKKKIVMDSLLETFTLISPVGWHKKERKGPLFVLMIRSYLTLPDAFAHCLSCIILYPGVKKLLNRVIVLSTWSHELIIKTKSFAFPFSLQNGLASQ